MRIGYHTSIAEGLKKTAMFIKSTNMSAMQIFAGSPRIYYVSKNNSERHHIKDLNCYKIVHLNYLVNPAKSRPAIPKSIIDNIKFCRDINADGLVIHWGSNENLKEGLHYSYENFLTVRNKIGLETKLLIETTAEGGNKLKFNTLIDFYQKYKDKLNLGLCFDTAHLYAAGYNVFELIEKYGKDIDVIHLNNPSPDVVFGNHLDRHNISLFDESGKFSKEEIYEILKLGVKYNIAMILETGDQHNDFLICESIKL